MKRFLLVSVLLAAFAPSAWAGRETWEILEQVVPETADKMDVRVASFAATIPLPAGAATAARQDTGNTSLSSIDGKLNSLGQKTMAASVPVVISSNQSAVPASQSGAWNVNRSTDAPAFTKQALLENRTYVYKSSNVLTAPTAVTLTGLGSSWFVAAKGSAVTVNVNGGDSIVLEDGQSIGSDFNLSSTNPTINVTALAAGATAQVILDGVN